MRVIVRRTVLRRGIRKLHRSSGTGVGVDIGVLFPRLLAARSLVYFTGSWLEDCVGDFLDAGDGDIARYEVNYMREGGRIGWFGWLGGGRRGGR
jgi:hypothetical protein